MAKGLLREAAALLRRRAGEAVAVPGERWMVDQDEAGALVVSAFVPEDVALDGTVSGAAVGWYAYPDNPQRAAHAHALAAASHTAALDPQTAVVLAVWLETTDALQERAQELGDAEGAAPLIEPATRFARSYLRAPEP
jgi:hypothetical protein